jgi:hypothetical protein
MALLAELDKTRRALAAIVASAAICLLMLGATSLLRSKRDGGKIIAFAFAVPPCAGFSMRCKIGEMVIVNDGANVTGRGIGEGVAFEQTQDVRRTLQKTDAEIDEPGVVAVIAQRSEPHLPIQARLMGGDEFWASIGIAGLVFEFVFQPRDAVVAAFDDNFRA